MICVEWKSIWQHREDVIAGFTRRYGVHMPAWFEVHHDVYQAISREQQLKKWKRCWKVELIEERNPKWRDLYLDVTA